MLRIMRMQFCRLILLAIALLLIPSLPSAHASEHHGSIHFNELPVPGATVTAMQGEKCLSALTNLQGVFSFSDLADGMWTLRIEMMGFQSMKQGILIGPDDSESV